MEARRLDARNAALALIALLVASVLVLLFRGALFTNAAWAWVYVGMDLLAIGLAGLVFLRLSQAQEEAPDTRRPHAPARTRPYPAVRGVYTIAGLGVIGALAEFGDQLFD